MSDVLVLCYHAVSRDWHAGMSVTPERLEADVGSVLRRGYAGATFADAVAGGNRAPLLAVTFDDAYRSVFELARPVLEGLGVPGTVYVPTALAGSESPMSWPGIDRWRGGPHECELMPMSWGELGELHELGWEIGSHTRTHPRLPSLPAGALREELAGSRADVEREIGARCRSLAYPYGDLDEGVVAAASAAGYESAGGLAGRNPHPDAMRWPRVGIYRGDGGWRFRVKVSRPARRLRATHAWRARFLMRRSAPSAAP